MRMSLYDNDLDEIFPMRFSRANKLVKRKLFFFRKKKFLKKKFQKSKEHTKSLFIFAN